MINVFEEAYGEINFKLMEDNILEYRKPQIIFNEEDGFSIYEG